MKRKYKKKNAFTLTELLAVVVILGIIVSISVSVYYTVSKNIKENEYNAKKQNIENKAVEYASENNIEGSITFLPVKLINNGLISAEKYVEENGTELPFIANPKNENDNLACHIITITQDSYDYSASMSDEEGDCSLAVQTASLDELGIKVFAVDGTKVTNELTAELTSESIYSYNWTNKDVVVFIDPTVLDKKKISVSLNGSTNEINGDILGGVSVNSTIDREYSNVLFVKASFILKQNITFYSQDKEDNGNLHNVTIEVKIDKEIPTISTESYDGFTANSKDAIAYISDGNGSGAKYAYITLNNDYSDISLPNTNKYEVKDGIAYINKANNEELGNGIYYIWAEDTAGNITTKSSELSIKNVDKVGPTGNVIITPKKNFNSYDTRVAVTASDTGIGVDSVCITLNNYKESEVSSNCNFKKFSLNAYSEDFNFGSTDGTGATFTLYVWIRDGVGRLYKNTKTYKLYKSCDQVKYVNGTCSNICGGGNQPIYAYDKYIADTRCSSKDDSVACGGMTPVQDTSSCSQKCSQGGSIGKYYVRYYSTLNSSYLCKEGYYGTECNTMDCCSSVTWGKYGKCSAECDGGTKTRTGTSNYDSSVTCSGSDSCNTRKCCDKVDITWGGCNNGKKKGTAYSAYDSTKRCPKKDKEESCQTASNPPAEEETPSTPCPNGTCWAPCTAGVGGKCCNGCCCGQ